MTGVGPLGNLRVLDLSRVLAGPWAAQTLADLGADVIKVERPGAGDDTRSWGPPWLTDDAGQPVASAYYLAANRGKRSVTVDLAHPEGQAVVRALAGAADVVLENYKAGTLERWGLDAASLRALHPQLVVCTISGFDPDGPDAARPGYDLLVQAMGGLMSFTGQPDGPPTKVGVAVSDLMTGMYAVVGIQAALAHRDRTGEGQHVRLSLYDTQVAWLANQAMNQLVGGLTPTRRGNAHPNIVPYQTFEASDGHLVVAVGNDAQFAALARVLGQPEWAADPRFVTNAARVAHRDALVAAIDDRVRTATRAAWEARLTEAGVPCGPVRDLAEVLPADAPQVLHLDDGGVDVPSVANPLRFEVTPLAAGRAPPRLGAHTDEVLREVLGWDEARIAAARRAGAFG